MNRRIGAAALLVIFVSLTAAAIFSSHHAKQADVAAIAANRVDALASKPVVCLIGSEKSDFFSDPRVVKILTDKGLPLTVQKEGSREMVFHTDLQNYDCAFPAGEPTAMAIKANQKVKDVYPVFFSPVVIASWTDLLKPLQAEGLVRKVGATYYLTDMHKLFEDMQQGKRWKDLPDNDKFAVGRALYPSSTDPLKSNSGQMYLALASYVANNDHVVSTSAEVDNVLPLMRKLVDEQGYLENSSAGPFDDYATMGMGKAPLVVSYESLFIAAAMHAPGFTQSRVLLYPTPTIYTKHILVPLSDRGAALGRLLTTDPDLRQIAIEYGFRTNDSGLFEKTVVTKMPFIPKEVLDVAEPPTFDVLETLLKRVASSRQ
ncbi:hypothetical protein [Paraburkholderia sp. SIMBA_054]|uniref:hypothetical protein n=1 Tax=Paraburkholderia sp. SIMBA_054 TaxID=3085795 RepID=UPI003978F56F